jgi:membrane dipeptidase
MASASAPDPATAQETEVSEEAHRIHRAALVVDGHNDLPWRIRGEADLDIEAMDLGRRTDEGHTDMVRLQEGGVDAQFWSTYVPANYDDSQGTLVELEQIDLVKRLVERFPEHLEMAYSTADIERIANEGKVASLIGIEGGHAIANSLPALRELYRAGARYMTLTHSRTLAWADAATDSARHGGLTEFGRKVVREMNRLGMLVDLSHVSADAMADALEASRAPVIFSHSSARALLDHPRNVPDRILRMMPENGGVVMVNFYSDFIVPEGEQEGENPLGTVGTIADHIDHIAEVAGIEHVGLGSDFDGVSRLPVGMEDVSKLPALTEELLRRGYEPDEIGMILGDNVMRAFRRAEEVAAELRETEPAPVDRLPYRGPHPPDDGESDGGEGS